MLYKLGLESHQEAEAALARVTVIDVVCEVCSGKFRREIDKKRLKCVSERQKPVNEQSGAAQCQSALGGSRAKEGWLSTDADQEVECCNGGMHVRLAAPP